VEQISGGGIYAHRDKISAGYLPLFDGVRVGVCGSARYEEGSLVGVENISSLVFRIPGNKCDIEAELLSAFRQASAGMLIYSPPGGGKTTALRSLAHSLGSGRAPLRVCVVDEREEFVAEDYSECEVDILKGYKRRNGIEIATRTMSPDVIIIDEIGCDDAAAIADAVRSGIPVVATAHAGSLIELKSKSLLRPLYDVGAFDVFAGISEKGGVHILTVNKDE
jgi:stage III sporulation protein AA